MTAAHQDLLARLKSMRDELETARGQVGGGSLHTDDLLYRFWHQSLKVYALQEVTRHIRGLLAEAADPALGLDPWYEEIVAAGTGRTFTLEDNGRWLEAAGPIVNAYLHSAHLLRLACEAVARYDRAPEGWYDPGWATLLHLYRMR